MENFTPQIGQRWRVRVGFNWFIVEINSFNFNEANITVIGREFRGKIIKENWNFTCFISEKVHSPHQKWMSEEYFYLPGQERVKDEAEH